MRVAPASGGATSASPGTNFATSSTFAPQRSKLVWVWLTQESGVRETRHSRFITRPPKTRPATYHTASPIRQAPSARVNTAPAGSRPSPAIAPATISVGTAGTGRPSWSHRTLRNTKERPIGLVTVRSCPAAPTRTRKLPGLDPGGALGEDRRHGIVDALLCFRTARIEQALIGGGVPH